jgi:hypothetical protein
MWSEVWVPVVTKSAWTFSYDVRASGAYRSVANHFYSRANTSAEVPNLSHATICFGPELEDLSVARPESAPSAFHLDHAYNPAFPRENIHRPVGRCASAAVPSLAPQLLEHLIFSASSSRISGGDHVSLGTCNWL